MTNLLPGREAGRDDGPMLRRLWLWTPIAVGVGASVLLAALVTVPQALGLGRDARRLAELEAMEQEITLTRQQLVQVDEREQEARTQQDKLVALITGSGDLRTFLASLDGLARLSGVQLDQFEPEVEAPPPPQAQGGQPDPNAPPPPPPDPLVEAGLEKESVLLSARGTYPALLQFLRGVEALSVLVVQSDLNLELQEAQGNAPPPARPVLLKLAVRMYGKPS